MPINIRQKGQEGEREVARALNTIVRRVLAKHGIPMPPVDPVQRNQNQSAVGGGDLSGTFGLSIEIKRQEQLAINTWWAQCEKSANRNNEEPVLVYRANRQSWRVVLYVELAIWVPPGSPSTKHSKVRAEISWDTFLSWFEYWVDAKINSGEKVKL